MQRIQDLAQGLHYKPWDSLSIREREIMDLWHQVQNAQKRFVKFGTLVEFDKFVQDQQGDLFSILEKGNALPESEKWSFMDMYTITSIMEILYDMNTPESRQILLILRQKKSLRNFVSLREVRLTNDENVKAALEKYPTETVEWLSTLVNNPKALQSIDAMSRENFVDAEYFVSMFNEQSYKTGIGKLDFYLPQTRWDDWIEIVNQSNLFWETLSENQKEAIRVQTNSTSEDENRDGFLINQFLRGGPDVLVRDRLTSDWVAILDTIFCSPAMPRFQKSTFLFRGIDRLRENKLDLQNDPGQKSTSLQPRSAIRHCQGDIFESESQCILLQIELPAKYPFFKIPSQGSRWSEQEIILSRSSRFVPTKGSFTAAKRNNILQIVRLKAVPNLQECI